MDIITHVARAKGVSAADCRVETTVLGYYPNLGAGYFFTIMFALCLVGTVVQGVRFKTWSYMGALTCGLILETAGYVGRILLHKNACNEGAFELQICAIILAPTFICVSIYLTLKHAAAALAPSISRIRPVWYPRIFLPGDLSCLIVQAIGGGIAAAAGRTNRNLQQSGNRAIIAGIVLQVIVLAFFGVMGVDYLVRVSKYMKTDKARQTEGYKVWGDRKARIFFASVSAAYLSVLIRCIYRVAEMAGGWGNKIMQDEPSFLVLDSTLVLVTAALLTIFHPGIYFPRMINGGTKIDGDQLIEGAEQERKSSPNDTSDEGPRSDV